ncbi:nitroreductase/quinone reductase family protein [Nocardioides sp. YIM 152588]|uniref:nitroreductase/quinone reductase family protein n=1 Tax=Nocardioides sp. YIM 152588 TaxID=3158259 RepID=UPI0032E37370
MTADRSPFRRLHGLKRWIYRDDRPNAVARTLNRFWARQYGAGGRLARARDVRLEVTGRTSGNPVSFPVVLADLDGEWYSVSMLGENANWVRNVRAAGGRAVIHHGDSWPVALHELPPDRRAPILKRYLDVAPGARPHVPVDRSAPVADFEAIAADFPVFRVEGFAPAG